MCGDHDHLSIHFTLPALRTTRCGLANLQVILMDRLYSFINRYDPTFISENIGTTRIFFLLTISDDTQGNMPCFRGAHRKHLFLSTSDLGVGKNRIRNDVAVVNIV